MRLILAVLLLLLGVGVAQAREVEGGRLDLGSTGFGPEGFVALDGEWEFVPGRLVGPDEPWPARESTLVTVPGEWESSPSNPAQGAGTYRVRVRCDVRGPLALSFPFQNSASTVFVNGREVVRQGRPGLTKDSTEPAFLNHTVTLEGVRCPVEIRVQLANFHLIRAGLMRRIHLGTQDGIEQRRHGELVRNALGVGFALVLGLFGLFSGFGRPRAAAGLYFAGFSFGLAVTMALSGERLVQPALAGIGFETEFRIYVVNLFLMYATHAPLFRALYPREGGRRVPQAMAGTCLLLAALMCFGPAALLWRAGPFLQAAWIAVAIYKLVVVVRATLHGERGAALVLVSIVVLFGSALLDNYPALRVSSGQMVPLAMIFVAVCVALQMGLRFKRALAAEELRAIEQGQRVDLLLRATKAGVLDWEMPTGERRASERYREMLGLPAETPAAALPAFESLVHPDDRERVAAALGRPARHGEPGGVQHLDPIEFRMVRPDGTTIWVHCEHISIFASDGGPLRRISTFVDITHLKSTEQQLREAQSRLVAEARQAGMAQIATNVLHNVGNVLTSVNVSAHVLAERVRGSRLPRVRDVAKLLESGEAADPQGERAKRLPVYVGELAQALETEQSELLRELERLRTSVDHIKNVVAMQQSYVGRTGAHEEVRATELVEDALRILRDAIARRGIEVHRDYAPIPALALDRTRIMQILVNLVENAVQAMEASAGQPRLGVRVGRQGGLLEIAVSDTGCGIAQADLARIFSHGFSTKPRGHGFGLHSCAVAAREMGGEMVVASDGRGLGATFTLRLPAASEKPASDTAPAAGLAVS